MKHKKMFKELLIALRDTPEMEESYGVHYVILVSNKCGCFFATAFLEELIPAKLAHELQHVDGFADYFDVTPEQASDFLYPTKGRKIVSDSPVEAEEYYQAGMKLLGESTELGD